MKLLIITQAVDRSDPVLGFFHRWLIEFSKHLEIVEVLCLRAGEHGLPANVHVHVLGKGKLARMTRFLGLCYSLRNEYDAIFVHMNPEYIVLAGLFWRLLGKRIGFWYTHKKVNLKLRIATLLADRVLTASKESLRIASKKVRIMGHGIDTDFFTPAPVSRGEHFLSAGRLMPSKRHDLAIRTAAAANRSLRIVGSGPQLLSLKKLASDLGVKAIFLGPLSQEALRTEYRQAGLFLHMSETGSLDKVVLEAIACGCPVRTRNQALKKLETEGPDYVRCHHSLLRLIPRILSVYEDAAS